MQRSVRLSLSLTVAATLALASSPVQPKSPIQPVATQEDDGSAADLGVMEICFLDLFSGDKG